MQAEDKVRVQPFSQGGGTWTQLVNAVPGATLYHSEPWIELLRRAYKFPLSLVSIERCGQPVAGCVLARSHNPLARRFIALPFSDCAPPLAIDGAAANDLLDALVEHAAPGSTYEIRGVARRSPWQTVDCFAQWNLALDRPLKAVEQGLALNFRRNLRRAQSEPITIERGSSIEHLRRFYALQLESRHRLGLPPQPWSFFRLAREIFAPRGDLNVWLASERGEDVASAVFLQSGDEVSLKWAARRPAGPSRANHLLIWSAIQHFASNCRKLDLGRADVRNQGLSRFKRELGATPDPLPYSFYPRRPAQISPEVLSGPGKVVARIWTRMPILATRIAASVIYRFLA